MIGEYKQVDWNMNIQQKCEQDRKNKNHWNVTFTGKELNWDGKFNLDIKEVFPTNMQIGKWPSNENPKGIEPSYFAV